MARDVVGKVIQATSRGYLLKAPKMVPIGTRLVDVRNQPAGRVADVLGPVASPYLFVSLPRGAQAPKLDREVYLP